MRPYGSDRGRGNRGGGFSGNAGAGPRGRGGGSSSRGNDRGNGRGNFRGGGGDRGTNFRGGRGGGGGPIVPQVAIVGQKGSLDAQSQRVLPAANITTIGVKRPGYGKEGRSMEVYVNAFEASIPRTIIRHYDAITPETLPVIFNMAIIKKMQDDNPKLFSPRVVYDGRKNIYSTHELKLEDGQEFSVTVRPPKAVKVKLSKVAEINPEIFERFVRGEQSTDNGVLTVINACSVVIRNEPFQNHTFNARSFYTPEGSQPIGLGLVLYPGLFQSFRPGIGRPFVNVDTSIALMYKAGPLLVLASEFLKLDLRNTHALSVALKNPKDRLLLARFILNLKVIIDPSVEGAAPRAFTIKKLSPKGADELYFTTRENGQMSVANYFKKVRNKPLQSPELPCVEVGSGAFIPLELCTVPPGQIVRRQIPPEKTKDVVTFASKLPKERLQRIVLGVQNTLAYGQSDYVRDFGLHINTDGPLLVNARVLQTPVLRYAASSKSATVVPTKGSWNMHGKRFVRAAEITQWFMVVYESKGRFNEENVKATVAGLVASWEAVGITVKNKTPLVWYPNGQGKIVKTLEYYFNAVQKQFPKQGAPNLAVIVLPEGANEIYTAVKHFGDCVQGVPTQCLKAIKLCNQSNAQYFANVAMKVNVKLGGINLTPDFNSLGGLYDALKPTLVIGADVIHPSPGSIGVPSYAGVVGSTDPTMSKYSAISRAQTSGQEMIDDLQSMCKQIIERFMGSLKSGERKPARIIFYRDGVSEGQFKQVIEKAACASLKISPKITLIVVGKRHHIRFFPVKDEDADASGNCPAGTVVDTVVAHPTEFDFYLQSHGGLKGTSRSAHYSVLYDENHFTADAIQKLSFALCHVYARATRSVSIPAPVYYADIVCSRARNHYDPEGDISKLSDTATHSSSDDMSLQQYTEKFMPLHKRMEDKMYFS